MRIHKTVLFMLLLLFFTNVENVYTQAKCSASGCNYGPSSSNSPPDSQDPGGDGSGGGDSPPPMEELPKLAEGELEAEEITNGIKGIKDILDKLAEAKNEANNTKRSLLDRVKALFKKDASPTTGDPVLLSSGAYTSTVHDIEWIYHELSLPLKRVYAENHRGRALGENWNLSLESHAVFGIDARIRELAASFEEQVLETEAKIAEWDDIITEWQDKIQKFQNSYRLGPSTLNLREELKNLKTKVDTFKQQLPQLKTQRDEYLRRLKVAEAHIQRNLYQGEYSSEAFFGNESILLVDETGRERLYKIAEAPTYTASAYYSGTSTINYFPNGAAFTADAPDADKLTMRNDGILVREKADLSRWYYDLYGRLYRVENHNGKGYSLKYAANSNELIEITDDGNRQISLNWSGGKLSSVEDYAGRRVTYSYSGSRLSRVTDPSGDVTRYEYTSDGRMKKTIKPDGTFIEQHYDYVGGKQVVTGTTDEEGHKELFSYTIANTKITEAVYTNPSGVKEVYQIHDHLVTRTSYSDGSFHEKEYNPLRQVIREVLQSGETLRYEYDNFGSITKTTYGDGSYTESSYRNSGRQITSFRDRRGNTTTYDYNAGGQLDEITYPMGQISRKETFTYNSEGLLASRQIENSLWTYQYDPYGQLTTVKIDNTTVEERSYDAAGSLAERIYANGIREAFTFRPDGLLTSLITYGKDGSISYREEYAYNSRKDRLSTTINDEIRHYFLYDRRHKLRHRILGVDVNAPAPSVFADETDLAALRQDYDIVESYTWRPDGKMASKEIHGEGGLYRWEYDYHPTGRLKEQSTFFNGEKISHESYRWENGLLTGLFDGEGRGHIYEQDSSGSSRKKTAALLSRQGSPQALSPYGRRIQETTYYRGGLPDTGTGLEGEHRRWHYDALGRLTGFEQEGLLRNSRQYDLLGRIVQREEAPGQSYQFGYDSQGRLSTVEGPDGQVIEERHYDSRTGELKTIRDPRNGSETHYTFDNQGRLSEVTDPEGYTVSYRYDTYNRLIAITDQAGETWGREYDTHNRMSATIDPLGHRYEYTYDPLGQVKEVENPLGAKYQYLYDTQGQLRQMTQGDGITQWDYDLAGNLIQRRHPTGRTEAYTYNSLNQMSAYHPASNAANTPGYQYRRRSDGLLTEETDPLGRTRSYRYDAQGRLIAETNQLGDSQSFRYNHQGDLIAHEDFEGHLYEYDYDEEGRLTQKTFNGQKEARYEYDQNGNLLKAVNELTGNELLYSYDRKNNLTAQTTEMGTTRYTFDGRGLKTQEVRPSQIIHYTYDERGSLLISEESLLARQKVSYRYNALGQEVRRDVSGSLIEKRHYNQWGRLLGITGHKVQFDDLVGPLLYGESYTYGPGGQKIHSTDLYGQITSYEYDEFDRLAAVSYPHDAGKVYADFEERLNLGLSPGTQGSPAKADIEKIEQIITQAKVKYPDYRFAEMDADSYMVPSPGGTAFRPYRNLSLSERSAVNETYRKVFGVRRTTPEVVSYTWREEFDYDGAGNRIQKRNGWGAVGYTYSGENRLIRAGEREYEYDGNGNVTQESAAGGRRRYFYNSLNRVERAEVNEGMARILNYEYDGLGRRVGMSSTLSGNTRYGYSGLGLNPIEEVFERGVGLPDDPRGSRNEGQAAPESRESLGRGRYMPYRKNRLSNQERFSQRQTPSMSETRSYVYKGRVPAARSTVGDGELRTLAYGHDALGSIRAVVSHGTVQEQYHYDAFGKPFGDELETDERGYNGKPYDAVLGHYNYGYRDYDPLTGRFATVDPIQDGRNWYVYTANDPVNFIDAWGLCSESTKDDPLFGFTLQLGLSGTGGAGTAVTAGGGIVLDIQFDWDKGFTIDKGFYTVLGTGALIGKTASLGVDLSFSTNNEKEDLEGQAITTGGSGKVNMLAVGGEVNIPMEGEASPSFTFTGTFGPGTPAEGHILVTDTVVNETLPGVFRETVERWRGVGE